MLRVVCFVASGRSVGGYCTSLCTRGGTCTLSLYSLLTITTGKLLSTHIGGMYVPTTTGPILLPHY